MRVLVADDDPTYRSFLESTLLKWHFDVSVACDGVEALEVIRGGEPPRLILLDWEMPRMDGFEVASAIRNEQGGQDVYVLMVTSNRSTRDMMRVLVCGADDYLIKPFDPVELQIHVRSAVRIMQLRDELRELRESMGMESSKAKEQ